MLLRTFSPTIFLRRLRADSGAAPPKHTQNLRRDTHWPPPRGAAPRACTAVRAAPPRVRSPQPSPPPGSPVGNASASSAGLRGAYGLGSISDLSPSLRTA